ncbi:hypothetical protein LMG23994_01292 [Cupriavidus pinatubonensis]|uniref:NADP-dependent oxidoreductase domain-containing protein n=1 Tax=Cupriavidus pinatubonensis TaxID=248026 RepID=A0ABM8WKZ1_9BURK|nr:hypothetical protein LMG23994_01292 [Cupriavidus pinatubonensis]
MRYGAMQLAGPGVFGPPKDRDAAIAVLREAVASGVNHIDTSDFYGPHITNQLIRAALHPGLDDLVIVTKVGARRGEDASWLPALEPEAIRQAVHDNLRNLGVEVLDVVNLRLMGDIHAPTEGSIEREVTALAELQRQGLVRHIGLSNVTSAQVAQARKITPVVCVQNQYNLVQRGDDALVDELAEKGIAYVPFFPLGGFTPIQSAGLSKVAEGNRGDGDAAGAGLVAASGAECVVDSGDFVGGVFEGELEGGGDCVDGCCACLRSWMNWRDPQGRVITQSAKLQVPSHWYCLYGLHLESDVVIHGTWRAQQWQLGEVSINQSVTV